MTDIEETDNSKGLNDRLYKRCKEPTFFSLSTHPHIHPDHDPHSLVCDLPNQWDDRLDPTVRPKIAVNTSCWRGVDIHNLYISCIGFPLGVTGGACQYQQTNPRLEELPGGSNKKPTAPPPPPARPLLFFEDAIFSPTFFDTDTPRLHPKNKTFSLEKEKKKHLQPPCMQRGRSP